MITKLLQLSASAKTDISIYIIETSNIIAFCSCFLDGNQ